MRYKHAGKFGAGCEKFGAEIKRIYEAVSVLQQQIADCKARRQTYYGGSSVNTAATLRQRFADIVLAAVCLIAGKELSLRLTLVIPGPPSAIAFLDHVSDCRKEQKYPESISLKDAINNTPDAWRAKMAKTIWVEALSNLTPVIKASDDFS